MAKVIHTILFIFVYGMFISCNRISLNMMKSNFLFGKIKRNRDFSLFSSIKFDSQDFTLCKMSIEKLFKKNSKDPLFKSFIEFGGNKLNDFGNYDECSQNSNTTFFLLQALSFNETQHYINFGLCVPGVCTNDTFYLVIQYYLSKIFPFLPPDYQLPIQIKDVKEYNRALNKITYGFYITITILIFYIILVLFATGKEYYLTYRNLERCANRKEIKNSLENSKKEIQKPKSTLIVILDCFSLKSNFEGILKTENRIDKGLDVFHFVRCIGMFWVVAGHMFMFAIIGNTFNLIEAGKQMFQGSLTAFIRNGSLSVDIFFTLSGFFSTLAFLNNFENKKNQTIKNLLLLYFHRYVRLFPLMIFGWALAVFLIPPIVNGVQTEGTYNNCQLCYSRFIQTFTYSDNFFIGMDHFCNGWIWFLFIDMQLFLVTPFIVFPIIKNLKLGLLMLIGCTLASLGYQTYLFQKDNFSGGTMADHGPLGSNYYEKTYTRCNTYFVGILFCYLYLESKGKKFVSCSFFHYFNFFNSLRLVRYLIVAFGSFLMIFIIFSQNYFDHATDLIPQYISILYLLFFRVLFVFGMMLVIYPSTLGYGRILVKFFGYAGFNVLAKITYGAYMLHLLVFQYIDSIVKDGFYYEYYHMILISIEIYFIGYLVSFFCTAIFESPIVQLLKLLTSSARATPNFSKDKESLKKIANKDLQ